MKKKICLMLLQVLIGCTALWAQDSIMTLTLDEAQKVAKEHNRTLKNASLDVQKAEATRWQTIASMLPQVNGSLDYQNMCGYKMSLGGMDIAMPPSGTLGITAALQFSGTQVVGAYLGTIAMKMADISLKQTEQQIGNQVKSIYYSILAMERTVNLLEQNLENLRTLHRTTQNSVDVGVAEQTDADQLSVQVATMETTISSTKRSLEMLYNSMRLQLGVAPEQRISLSQSIEELINFENALSLLSEEFVIDNNYNYQLLKENTRLAKQQVHMKEWAYGPTITAAYQYSAKKYFSDERTMNMTPPNAISISLSVPIFSSGRNFTGVKEAKLAYKKQLNTLADTEDGLNIQHSQLKYNLSSAYESFDTQKKNVEVSQRVFTNISNKYEHGLASSLDVTNSGSNLISAQSSYVQALLELVNAQIELEELLNL
jgi:outer membrane protein TolC